MLCFHGAPEDVNAPLDSCTLDDDLTRWLAGYSATLMVTGHMHLPMLRTFGDTTLINPGSVGLPYGGKRLMPAQAQYVMIESQQGTLSIHFHTLAYNGELLKDAILQSGMPYADWYASLWAI
jgi:predicted phosphodiesterase